MNIGRTVFAQQDHVALVRVSQMRHALPLRRSPANFSCWDQFLATFAQLTYRESLRDIEAFCVP